MTMMLMIYVQPQLWRPSGCLVAVFWSASGCPCPRRRGQPERNQKTTENQPDGRDEDGDDGGCCHHRCHVKAQLRAARLTSRRAPLLEPPRLVTLSRLSSFGSPPLPLAVSCSAHSSLPPKLRKRQHVVPNCWHARGSDAMGATCMCAPSDRCLLITGTCEVNCGWHGVLHRVGHESSHALFRLVVFSNWFQRAVLPGGLGTLHHQRDLADTYKLCHATCRSEGSCVQ